MRPELPVTMHFVSACESWRKAQIDGAKLPVRDFGLKLLFPARHLPRDAISVQSPFKCQECCTIGFIPWELCLESAAGFISASRWLFLRRDWCRVGILWRKGWSLRCLCPGKHRFRTAFSEAESRCKGPFQGIYFIGMRFWMGWMGKENLMNWVGSLLSVVWPNLNVWHWTTSVVGFSGSVLSVHKRRSRKHVRATGKSHALFQFGCSCCLVRRACSFFWNKRLLFYFRTAGSVLLIVCRSCLHTVVILATPAESYSRSNLYK